MMAAVMGVMRLATQRAKHLWKAFALRVVGVTLRLAVAVMKVQAIKMNTAAVAAKVTEVTVLLILLKLREIVQLTVQI
jgi:hypothetical protein